MDNIPLMSAEEARRIAEEEQRAIGLNYVETVIKEQISKSAHSGLTNCAVAIDGCYSELIEQTILKLHMFEILRLESFMF